MPAVPAEAQGSWQPDPYGGASWRWWDGRAWGAQTGPADPDAGFEPIRSALGGQLVLQRETAGSDGALMLGSQRVAQIHKPPVGDGQAHCAEGSWLFEGNAITAERRVVRSLPSRAEIGRFEWGDGGFLAMPGSNGMLVFPDGRHFRFPRTADLQGRSGGLLGDVKAMAAPDWTFMGSANTPLLRAQFGQAPWDRVGHVGAGALWIDVYPVAAEVIELPLLILLATFLTWAMASSTESRQRLRHDGF